ncbi:isochorismate synthase [Aequorivita antarctica]|uniref:isochorismate synthase n=1 Tax=Aequorivita antarctica TaxID=153266 RepID=A0A5C6Z256_9FLAO|nr:isochorismate synthase [Aequorivita antarctica]TXD74191.1 isochorismate synthase [Aequorivita antarctica]SRX75955.1 Isochorismate synthase EntC [Aequorivita antarctica]
MDYNLLIEKLLKHHSKNLPFVVFSLPESNSMNAFFQKDMQLCTVNKLTENGFVFAPFDYKDTTFFIPENDSESLQCEFINHNIELTSVTVSDDIEEKESYIKLVDKAIEAIKKRSANKIVVSRQKDFELKDFSIEKLIERLFSSYPTAFRYIWYHPNTGLWCGATPETLVQIENNSFKTMALAGTQPFTNRVPVFWGSKELDEQQLVTDVIIDSLQRVTSVLKVSNPFTYQAGSLLHLRTDITGVLKNGKATLTTITAALHPTPAVCGSPQKFANEFILENEGYNREFYTGFLGPILENGQSASLMVNLRCMKIEGNIAHVFVGGGITLGSQPQDEWNETQNKMQTMLQVLQPML